MAAAVFICPYSACLPLLPWTVWSTGLWLECPALARGSSCTAPGPSLGSGPQQQAHSGSSTVRTRWLKWHPPPSPGLSPDDQGSCKDPVPLRPLHPSANSHLLHPCCPWGLQSPAAWLFLSPLYCWTPRSPYPCIALQSGLKRASRSQKASKLTLPQLLNCLSLHSMRVGWAR